MTQSATETRDAPVNMMELIQMDPIDVVAIERRARELRAQALADAMRATVRFVLRRGASAEAPVRSGQPA